MTMLLLKVYFQLLKRELIKKKIYTTMSEVRTDNFEYLEMFYNRIRRHSHLDGMSPEAFEPSVYSGLPTPKILIFLYKLIFFKDLKPSDKV